MGCLRRGARDLQNPFFSRSMMDAGWKRPVRGPGQGPVLARDEWIEKYTGRILRAWFHQPAALGLAWTYANWIRQELAAAYNHPLKRAFIEETY